MISVAAELTGVHPQTLRIYERKRLIRPQRSQGNTRLYSQADIERLRLIQRLTQDEGVNLAGVERILCLQAEVETARGEIERLRRRAEEAERRARSEAARAHRRHKAEIVLVKRGRLSTRRSEES
ncbi:MAG: MerR family transcriptional regulator [Coriobacteriia bacterium]|nr:MerR family transcriptional regulator [Coriobacteriia bacterium]